MVDTLEQYRFSGRTAREIAREVEEAVRRGVLSPGHTLPTIRALAADLGVSPATTAAAYRELARRGVVLGAGRGGTKVRAAPPLALRLPLVVPAGVRDLRSGGPDPALLPRAVPFTAPVRLYGEASVSPRLAVVAAEQLAADGVDPAHLAVVAGALDGVERVLMAWLRPGDRVAVEDPGYSAAIDLLRALGLEVVPLSMDDRGVRPDALAEALRRDVQAVLLTPRAQNPTGVAWDDERAAAVGRVLGGRREVLVVEDDHAGPVSGRPLHSVAGGRERWAVIRSVSKWLGPDLRVAFLAGDPTTVSRVEGRQALGCGWVSYVLQDAVASLASDRTTNRLLREAADTYTRRRRALTEALGSHGLEATGSSGLTTWIAVADEHAVMAGLLDQGWAVSPGERFRVVAPAGIRVAFATLREDEAPLLAAALARCVEQRPVRVG